MLAALAARTVYPAVYIADGVLIHYICGFICSLVSASAL